MQKRKEYIERTPVCLDVQRWLKAESGVSTLRQTHWQPNPEGI